MASVLYKDGETIRVPYERLKANLASGWSTSPNAPKHEPVAPAEDDAELAAARELYVEKFGKKPHHKMKVETILSELSESDD